MNQYLKELLSQTERNLKWRDQSNEYFRKLHGHAYNSKQVLGLLSIFGLPCIVYVLSPFPWKIKLPWIFFSGYSALVIFALYKEYSLNSSIIMHNRSMAILLDLCVKMANERGAKLQIEPRLETYGIEIISSSTCQLELKAVLKEDENEMPFFTARIPLSNDLGSTFSVAPSTDKTIDVWFNEKTLSHLKEQPLRHKAP